VAFVQWLADEYAATGQRTRREGNKGRLTANLTA
jgi:hypothetical protein